MTGIQWLAVACACDDDMNDLGRSDLCHADALRRVLCPQRADGVTAVEEQSAVY